MFAKRLEDWPARLYAALDEAKKKPFKWGEYHCIHFAADCVQAMTGSAPALRTLRGRAAVMRELVRLGGTMAAMRNKHGEGVPVALAQRGDMVVAIRENGEALGVCVGDRAVFAAPEGLTYLPLKECMRAWHV